MKKKLLTVLLSAVMIFGVFGLTACSSGSNPADDYNYYRSVYSSLKDEEDIRIHSVVFLALEMMAKTSDNYLIYTGGAWDSKAQANIKDLNDLAKHYNVEVYNLDLRLDGGLSKGQTTGEYYAETLTDGSTLVYDKGIYLNDAGYIAGSGESTKVQGIYNQLKTWGYTDKDGKIPEATLFGVSGGKVKAITENVANATTDNKNYAIGSTKAAMEDVILMTAAKSPSYAGKESSDKDYKLDASAILDGGIASFDYFGDGRLHMGDVADNGNGGPGEDQFDGVDSVYEVITLHEFIDILGNCQGSYQVFFGGAWCPNTQAIAFLTNSVAKDYGVERVFFFDPNLDGGSSAGASINIRTSNQYPDGSAMKAGSNFRPGTAVNSGSSDPDPSKVQVADLDKSSAVFSGLYNLLVDTMEKGGQKYTSYWNEAYNTANSLLWINGKVKSRMCVPCIMSFEYNASAKTGKLVTWREAEYYYASTSVEDNMYREGWIQASKDVMDTNPYAIYNPIVVEEEAPAGDAGASGGSTGGSTGGGGGGDAGGGC